MELKRLNSDVITKIRSSFTINNVCQSVLELVLNSLDAKAAAIAIRLNLVTLRIQVVDNGEGIPNENMELIGLRYFTNKCKNIKELEKYIHYYGYRGEALANIAELSKTVNITTKFKNSTITYTKNIEKNNGIVTTTKERPSVGTTVTVEGLFDNYPVRKRRIISELEMEEIVKNIKSLIIIHPDVIFSIRDDVTGELVLNSRRSDDVLTAFKYLHPNIEEEGTIMKISKGKVTISAVLFKTYHENKRMQYIYVNKRPIFSTKITKCLDKLFHANVKQQRNRLKNTKSYPVYVLNVRSPNSEVDILLNPTKTMVEFKNWEIIERCIQKLINSFFGNNENDRKLKSLQVNPLEVQNKTECGVSQIHGVIRAFGYKRKHIDNEATTTETFKKADDKSIKSILKNSQCSTTPKKKPNSDEMYDIIESTPYNERKKNIFNFKPPLPITIMPGEKKLFKNPNMPQICIEPKEIPAFSEMDYDKSMSKFNNDENKGKNLIMSMFLKSTQVYKSEEDIKKLSQGSQETIYEEESNLIVENNFKTMFDGISKAMSVSVNVKSTKKIRKKQKINATKAIQTTLDNEMISKGLQTTKKEPDNFFQNITDNNVPVDDYTIVLSKNKSPRFEFVINKPEDVRKFNFTYSQKCNCNCHGSNNKKIFNFQPNECLKENLFSNMLNKKLTCSNEILKHTENKFIQARNNVRREFFKQPRNEIYWTVQKKSEKFDNRKLCEQSPYFKSKNVYNCFQKEIFPQKISTKNFFDVNNHVNTNFDLFNGQQYVSSYSKKQHNIISDQQIEEYCGDNVASSCNMPIASFGKFKISPSSQKRQNLDFNQLQNECENNNDSYLVESFSKFVPNFCSTQENDKINTSLLDNTHFNNNNENEEKKEELNSELIVSVSENDKMDLLEQELGAEKSLLLKEFLEWNSQFTLEEDEDVDDRIWTKRFHFGRKYYVNKKTGYVTYATPKQETNLFVLTKRNEFLPKGMSPILKEIKPVDKSLSQNGKNTLLEYIMETYKTELHYIKWQHYLTNVDFNVFLTNMYKEKLKIFENCVPNINTFNKKTDMGSISLNKNILNSLQIIGQLDKKFIIVKENKENMLMIFDQHAVHERIRLEKLWKIYKNSKSRCNDKIILFLTQMDLSLLKRYEAYLNYVGIKLEFFTNGIYVTEVPLCLQKFKEQESTESLNKMIQILINEVIELLKSTRGVSLKILPRLLQNVINLEACRGAIKFGDILNNQQCEELLKKLTSCELPFQCAHGRPTVTPLIKLHVNVEDKENSINFRSLRKEQV